VDSEPSAGNPAEPHKSSPVEAGRTQGSTNAVFLHKAQNRSEEERRRLVVDGLDTALEVLEETKVTFLAVDGQLERMTTRLQTLMETLRFR
jgi:hypothetical protein